MATENLLFTFRGDEFEVALLDDGDVGVPLYQLCKPFGLDASEQCDRLESRAAAGATWAQLLTVRRTFADTSCVLLVLRRRSIPLWAASVDLCRVSVGLLPKLSAYQDKLADVLAAAFLPPTHAAPPSLGRRQALLKTLVDALQAAIADREHQEANVLMSTIGALLSTEQGR
jgi:hypothetical protein